jgi:hypothetical protein
MDPDKTAGALRDQVRDEEARRRAQYESEDVRRAVVHTREDLVMVDSYLSDAVHLLRPIKWLLVVIAIATVVSAVALVWSLLG